MAYASWSVVFGEQPSTAKWNILGTNDASFNDGTGIANMAVSTTAISNPYKFSASRTTALTSGVGYSKITFNAEAFDTNSNFDTTLGRYTAPVNGFYFFTGKVQTAVPGADFIILLYKNGVALTRGDMDSNVTAPYSAGLNVVTLVQATAGDYFEIYQYTSSASTVDVTAGSRPEFTGFLVSQT